MSDNDIKMKLADKLRELKKAIDSLDWYECEDYGKFLLKGLDEIHSYMDKKHERIVCLKCMTEYEMSPLEEVSR